MTGFFDSSGFPPRWYCGDWSPFLGWLTISSDLVIFAAYTAIPLTIILYLKRRREVPFPHLFWLFCAFIFSCGTTHLIEAIIFWHPIYPVQGVLKAFTALISVAAVVATARSMPAALAVPGLVALNQRLQGEIAANAQSQLELREMATRLEEKRRRLLAAQAAAELGDWTYDPQSQQIVWSDEVFRLHERDPQQGPPRTYEENLRLYTEAGASALNQAMSQIEAGASRVEVDLEVALPAGKRAWHHAILHADRNQDGVIRRLWGTAQNITQQKLDLIEMERRTVEMERVNRQLEQFAYIASHDLLEPLRKMRFFADMIEEEVRERLSPEGQDAMRRFGSASDRMSRLVRDLLAFARAGKSLGETKPVELAEVVAAAIENLDRPFKANQAQVAADALPTVQGDAGLLTQVFQNLFANSLRYRHPERDPRIEVHTHQERQIVRIEVRDNGLGFAPEQARRLFEPFVRLHPQVNSEGTGIGLAICLRIIEAHGGTITAAPGVPCGAIFTIRLPLAQDLVV
jgi:signal transduction histidine kinase